MLQILFSAPSFLFQSHKFLQSIYYRGNVINCFKTIIIGPSETTTFYFYFSKILLPFKFVRVNLKWFPWDYNYLQPTASAIRLNLEWLVSALSIVFNLIYKIQ